MPTLISDNTNSSLIGITAQATKAKVIVTIGASINTALLALAGMLGYSNIKNYSFH